MKRRTGNTKVARAIALALATVVAVTSVPVAALAEGDDSPQVQPVIVVEDPSEGAAEGATVTLDFSSENVTDDTKEVVVEAQQSYDEAGNAETAANAAAEAAAFAATYAGNAEQAATNAETVANAAQALADTLIGKNAIDMTAVDKSVEAAETAVGDANSAIATYNSNVNDVNAKIDLANNSKNDDEKTGALGTDSLIAAATNEGEGSAQAAVNAAIQDAKDNYVKEEEIENVRSEVGTADQAYVDADTDAKTALATINQNLTTALTGTDIVANAKTAADNAEKAKEEAVKHQDSASKALDKTVENYNEVKKLVESNSHDVAAANKFAQDAATAAVEARNAADDAEKAAKAASDAADVAKQKRDAAKTAVDNATNALNDAWSVFKKAYAAAEGLADTADGKVEDLVGDGKGKKGKIETANEKIETAKTAVSNFNNTEVKNANDAIKNTNDLIDAAQQAIDELDPVEAQKITDAIDAVTNAQDALDAANEDLAEAQESYNDSLKEKKTAAEYAKDANTFADKAEEQVSVIDYQISLAQASEAITKDNLSKITNGVNFATLDQRQKTADKEYNQAVSNKNEADKAVENAEAKQREVYDVQNPIITEKQGIIDTETRNLGSATTGGLYKQQKDLDDRIKQIGGAVKDYNDAKKIEDGWKEKYKNLDWYDWLYGRGEYIATQYGLSQLNTNNKLDDLNSVIGQNPGSAEQSLALAASLKSTAETTKATVDSNITAAEGRKSDAQSDKATAEGLKAAEDAKVNNAKIQQTNAGKALDSATSAKTKADEDFAKVNDFVVNEENSLTLSAEETKLIKDVIAAYGSGYTEFNDTDYSWLAMDADTTLYDHVKSGTVVGDVIADVVNFFGHWFSDDDVMEADKNKREEAIENKYSQKGNVLLVWDDDKGWFKTYNEVDEDNYKKLQNLVDSKCVLICMDVEKASEIKASLAVLNAQKAKAEAEAATKNANDKKKNLTDIRDRAEAAKNKEAAALGNFETALGEFNTTAENLQAKLNVLENLDDDGKPVRGEDKKVSTKLTKQNEVKELTGKYTMEDGGETKDLVIGNKVYNGPGEIEDPKLSKTNRLAEIPFETLLDLLKAKQNGEEITDDNGLEIILSDIPESQIETLIPIIENLIEARTELANTEEELAKAQGESDKAEELKKVADKNAEDAEKKAKDAADLAKKVTPAPAFVNDDPGSDIDPSTPGNNDTPGDPSDDDDAGSGAGTSEPVVAVFPAAGAAAIAPVATPVITTAAAAGTTTPATAAMARPASGVAGVRAENSAEAVDNDGSSSDSQKEEKMVIAAKKSEPKKSAKNTAKKADKSTKKIGDTEVPLAATDQDNKSPLVVLWGLLLAAGLITIEEYIRRTHNKNKVEAQNELNDKK